MAYCYATSNLLTGLAASAFTFSAGPSDATRTRLNDTRMDSRFTASAGTSGQTCIIDMGAATALTGFALLNTNCAVQKADAAVRVRGATDAAITTSVVVAKAASTLNSAAPKNKDHVLQFASVSKRYWELTFTWTGTVTNFSIGELWAFNAQTQLTRKSIYGGGESEEIKNAQVDFYSGNSRGYFLGGPVRELQLPFEDLTASQREELAILWRTVKNGAAPFLWMPSYEATATTAAVAEQEVVYGRLQVPTFKWVENDYLLYQPPELIIRSLGREIGS